MSHGHEDHKLSVSFDVDAAQRYLHNEEGTYEMVRYYLAEAVAEVRKLREELAEERTGNWRAVREAEAARREGQS